MPRRVLVFLSLLCTFAPAAAWPAPIVRGAALAGAAQETSDTWWLFKLAGQPVGYQHEVITIEGGGDNTRLVTLAEQVMAVKRLGSEIKLTQSATTWETADGHLLRVQSSMNASSMVMKVEATVGKGELLVKSGTGDQSYESKLPFMGDLWGPEKIRRMSVSALKNVGDKLAYQLYEPLQVGGVIKATRTLVGFEDAGSERLARIDEEMEGVPFKNTLWLDAKGGTVKTSSDVPLLGGSAETTRSTKADALKAAGGNELSGDIFKSSIARSNIRLPQPRSLDRLVLRLVLKDPKIGWPELNDERQKTLEKTASVQLLEIRKILPESAATRPAAVSDENRIYLEPNAYLQADDPEIKRIAEQVAGKETDAFKAGQALERWVYHNLTGKGFGVGFASASEVCKNREGDCSEHAVFLAALCRAAGIPSRVTMGLEYLAGMWGGHAWTEIMVGSQWIALDATLGIGSVDAAHLRLSASSMKDGFSKDVMSTAQLLGNVEIKVVEFGVGAKAYKVNEGAASYVVDGNSYQNPWLGVALTKPASFTFTDLDAVYPDMTVVAMSAPDHATEATLRQGMVVGGQNPDDAARDALARYGASEKRHWEQVSGNRALIAGGEAAGVAVIRGTDLFVLTVKGTAAAELLDTLRQSFEVR
ncbi:MAG: transglutaminase-like domain-containing protein [Planctomycetota bacterium]